MTVDMKTYNRSTHDLSFAWRSTMGVGTLVPALKILGLPGDTFDIEVDTKILTHPTVGPLFGSYKFQLDVFTCPIRLYQAMLHNNALNVGLDMSKVKLPKIKVTLAKTDWPKIDNKWSQIHPSCVLAYLGQRGWGQVEGDVKKLAVPILAYLDIFKNYYANKQEKKFYAILQDSTQVYQIDPSMLQTGEFNKWTGGKITILKPVGGADLQPAIAEDIRIACLAGDVGGMKYNYYRNEDLNNAGFTGPSPDGKGNLFYEYGRTGRNTDLFGIPLFAEKDGANILKSYDLEEIDTIRESLLAAGRTEVVIDSTTAAKYGNYLKDLLSKQTDTKQLTTVLPGTGLLIKTHQSDIFNNWINTEWIDGDNGINAITAIDTSGGEFTLDTLNLAKKVYDMLNRIAVSGGTYQDWVEAVYTTDYSIHAETPIYEGGMSSEIVFDEVVSNSATAEQPLGTLAGRGMNRGKKGGKLHIKLSEPAYIIGIASITPRVDYCQGNDFDIDLETMDDLHKPALDGIGFQDLTLNKLAWWKDNKTSVGKQPAWIDYMTNFNKTYGNFAIEDNEAFMVLNRIYEPNAGAYEKGELNTTTYINPQDFIYTFAEQSLEAQDFWVQIGWGIRARRVMSAKQIPNL